ncbi:MAG: DUF2480 family protein [Crocinitomicaceae bacterium]
MKEEIVNKIAEAKIKQIDLKSFDVVNEVISIDLKERLWNELVLKEKDFREWIKEQDWSVYKEKNVCIFCSTDAIIPAWAFMLLTAHLQHAKNVVYQHPEKAREDFFFENLRQWDVTELKDQRVMVKGCSDIPNPNKAYTELTKKLTPIVKSLMFGEPCSAVPVYKKR